MSEPYGPLKDDELEAIEEDPHIRISEKTPWQVKDFFKWLLKLFQDYESNKERAYEEFLGVKEEDRIVIRQDWYMWQRSQAIYSINKFLEKNTKIEKLTNYEESTAGTSPTYEPIRIKRDEEESLVTIGTYFVKWKGLPFIVELWFRGMACYYKIVSARKNLEKAHEMNEEVKRFFKEHNFLKGEKLEFLPRGYIDFLDYEELSWDDIVLPEEDKEELEINLLYPILHPKEFKGKIWKRGVLLGGPVGTGKTQVCRVITSLLSDVTVIWATPKSVTSPDAVASLFHAARALKPTLIVLEDLDFIGETRDLIKDPTLGELLSQLDGSAPNEGVFVLATTNRPHVLDKALSYRPGRFDVKLEIREPKEPERKKLILLFSKGLPLKRVDIENLVRLTEGLTGAHIREIFSYAYFRMKKEGRKFITEEDLLKAIKRLKERSARKGYVA